MVYYTTHPAVISIPNPHGFAFAQAPCIGVVLCRKKDVKFHTWENAQNCEQTIAICGSISQIRLIPQKKLDTAWDEGYN
jgi:hypothetical protein